MKNWAIYFIIFFGVFGVGCGARKTETDISKQSNEVRQEQQTKETGKVEEKSEDKSETESKSDIKQVEETTITNTKFDTNGNKTEETKTTTKKDLTDKSTRIERRTIRYIRTIGWTNERTFKIKETVTIYTKQKKTWRQDAWMYVALAFIAYHVIRFGWKKIKGRV